MTAFVRHVTQQPQLRPVWQGPLCKICAFASQEVTFGPIWRTRTGEKLGAAELLNGSVNDSGSSKWQRSFQARWVAAGSWGEWVCGPTLKATGRRLERGGGLQKMIGVCVWDKSRPTSSGELGRKRGFSMSSSFLMPSITLSLRVCLNCFSLSQRARLNRRSRLVLAGKKQKTGNKYFFFFMYIYFFISLLICLCRQNIPFSAHCLNHFQTIHDPSHHYYVSWRVISFLWYPVIQEWWTSYSLKIIIIHF